MFSVLVSVDSSCTSQIVPFFVILKSIEVFLFSTESLWSRLLVFSALKSHLRLAVQDFQRNPCVEIKEAQRMKYQLINYQLGKKRVHMLSGVSLEGQESPLDIILEELLCSEGLLWLPSSQIASSAFTLGTVAVLPFYTFMVAAPEAKLTKKIIASNIPYTVLGLLYAYLLYLSWTPDTIRLMFASKYWLPELTGISKMFSNEMTLASAWIHLLAVDLFAARQVYYDGLKNNVEMRHSISLCLLFCPLGILVHFITRAFTESRKRREHGDTSR